MTKPPLEPTVRQELDRRAEQLDAHSLSRLSRARAAALASLDRRAWYAGLQAPGWALATGGLAVVLGVGIGLLLWLQAPTPEFPLQVLVGTDAVLIEMAEADLDIELLEEVEFYDWLMVAQAAGEAP